MSRDRALKLRNRIQGRLITFLIKAGLYLFILSVERRRLSRALDALRGPGGLHEKISEIDFLVVPYRGDRYLKNIVPS